jgi:hypothetical protein
MTIKLIILWIMLAVSLAATVAAQICPTLEPGYIRRPRPAEITPLHAPAGDPGCFARGTNEAGSYAACILCHDYLWRNAA